MPVATTAGLLSSFYLILPEAALVAAACILLVGATFVPDERQGAAEYEGVWPALAFFGILAAGVFWLVGETAVGPVGALPFRNDSFTWFIRGSSLAVGLVLVLLAWNQATGAKAPEFFACLLVLVAGTNLTAAANDFVHLFLALELVSIPTYFFLYLSRGDRSGQEAVIKYFLLSVFSSAIFLYGVSLLYGVAGTTNFVQAEWTLSQLTKPAVQPLL
ncbi:MAG: proton-conducting transporter membrane subunit, partial [Planctomycetia bacterium]